ncbi:UNVERIFIED_CONTAM: hypothetical protein FKN15_035403 [Acipenser sinensis]
MQYILNPISTWCVGQAASMGSLLLAAGSPGMRHSLPNSRIMIHQPSGGTRGQATDIAIQAEEILKLKKQINVIYAKHTKQPLEVIGGVVTAGLGIYDTMQYILNPISTWCVGQAASMGSLLLAAGSPGMRHSLPNSRIMIHQPSGGTRGQATDIAIQAEEILKLKKQINVIYAKHTKQPLEVIEGVMERDRYLSSVEAQDFGIIDKVLVHPPHAGEDEPQLVQKEMLSTLTSSKPEP